MEEQSLGEETPETTPPTLDLDQKIQVGGKEYTLKELSDAQQNLETMQAQNAELHKFRESTMRLMDPDADPGAKKEDARSMLLSAGYSPDQVEEWIQVYDEQEQPMAENSQQPMQDETARRDNARMQEEINRIRAQNLKTQMENEISSAVENNEDSKVLIDWIKSTRGDDALSSARERITEQVRANALENLRRRRDQSGTFEDSWVAEEVKKAATKVSQDMLTVIGDTSKIGRVSETAGQTETLSRRKPVELPDNKGKSFGDVEGQLRDWTTDQILRSLAEPGGDSKA